MSNFAEKDYTTIHFDAVSDITDEWASTCSEFSSALLKASDDPTFKILEELGLSGGFPGRYDAAMQSIISGITSEIGAAKAALDSIAEQDKNLEKDKPKNPRKKTGGDGGGNNTPGVDDTTPPEDEGIGEPAIDNTKAQQAYFEGLSLNDLSEIVNALNTIATEYNIPIDELLDKNELGQDIIDKLLQNPKLSEEYKAMLTEGTSEASITALKSFVKGEPTKALGLDDDATLLILKTHLINIANENNLEYDDLVGASTNYSNVLKKGLGDMKSIVSSLGNVTKDNVQSALMSIYSGNYDSEKDKISDLTQSLVRAEVDLLSNSQNIYYEDLLGKKEYGDALYDCVDKLKRASIYSCLLSNCKSSSSILSSIIK